MSIINTRLEDEFNLMAIESETNNVVDTALTKQILSSNETIEKINEYDKIEAALPQVYGLNQSDEELDEVAKLAISGYKDLMDLSLNVEQRFCGEIAGAASNMLGHLLNARTNKIKKKLDMINLQIKKQVADHKTKTIEEPEELVGGTVLDRTELLKHLLGNSPQNNKK